MENQRKLVRSIKDKMIGGVCGGIAEYFGWDSTPIRIVWVLATIFTAFAGVIVYIILLLIMPKDQI
jgi:phage shock protein C